MKKIAIIGGTGGQGRDCIKMGRELANIFIDPERKVKLALVPII